MADERDQQVAAQLSEFGDAVEALVSPPGAADARRLGRRRRKRRRETVAGAVSTVVLAATAWGVMPAVDDTGRKEEASRPGEYAVAASVLPPSDPDGRLSRAMLLSPSALPWHDTYQWQAGKLGGASAIPLPRVGACHLRWPRSSPPADEVAASYAGRGTAYAQHRIASYADRSQVVAAFDALDRTLRSCGWHEKQPVTTSHGPRPDATQEYGVTVDNAPARVTVVRRGDQVGLLLVSAGTHAQR